MTDTALITAGFGLVGAVVVAVITWLQHRGARVAETRSTDLRTIVERLDREVAELRTEVKALREEREELRGENRRLDDQVRDQTELIDDVMAYLSDHQDWIDAGSMPPPPVHSWRMLAAMRAHRARHAQNRKDQP